MEDSKKRGKPLKRHPALIPLSKDHHFGLLLSWKIRRGLQKGVELERITGYVRYFFEHHLEKHFLAEEQYIFPLLEEVDEKRIMAEDQHRSIRLLIQQLSNESQKLEVALINFEKELEAHIRFEERVLFQYLQTTLDEAALEWLKKKIEQVHQASAEDWPDRFWEG